MYRIITLHIRRNISRMFWYKHDVVCAMLYLTKTNEVTISLRHCSSSLETFHETYQRQTAIRDGCIRRLGSHWNSESCYKCSKLRCKCNLFIQISKKGVTCDVAEL